MSARADRVCRLPQGFFPNAVNKIVDAKPSAAGGPTRVSHRPPRPHRARLRGQRLRAWPQAALRLLLALALLANLVVLPAMATGASAMDAAWRHSAEIHPTSANHASGLATANAAADEPAENDPAQPSPHAPVLADANVCNEYADSEHALPAPPLDDCGRRSGSTTLPDIALAAPLRPQGPDPRPPLA